MAAEALGPNCRIVSGDWNAWGLELGDCSKEYPDRVRIQVKNAARTQSWHRRSQRLTKCKWSRTLRNKPNFFDEYNPGIPCEEYGFLCDAFILCHHPIEDWSRADHRVVDQWDFFIVPVTKRHSIYNVVIPDSLPAKSKSYSVLPASIRSGAVRRNSWRVHSLYS